MLNYLQHFIFVTNAFTAYETLLQFITFYFENMFGNLISIPE